MRCLKAVIIIILKTKYNEEVWQNDTLRFCRNLALNEKKIKIKIKLTFFSLSFAAKVKKNIKSKLLEKISKK